MEFGTEASPVGSPSPRPGPGGVRVIPSAKGEPEVGRIRVGAYVQVAGRRGRFRVIGLTPHGVELRDRDERWHAVRPEAVRVVDGPGKLRRALGHQQDTEPPFGQMAGLCEHLAAAGVIVRVGQYPRKVAADGLDGA